MEQVKTPDQSGYKYARLEKEPTKEDVIQYLEKGQAEQVKTPQVLSVQENEFKIAAKEYSGLIKHMDSIHREAAELDFEAGCKYAANQFKEENELLKREFTGGEVAAAAYQTHAKLIQEKEEENARLREALEWYADSGNYLYSDTELGTAWASNKNIENKAKQALQPQK